METPADTPALLVTSAMLPANVKKSVIFAGKVTQVDDSTLTLDGGNGGPRVTVHRAQPAMVHVDRDMTLIVRGIVNDDNSISECAGLSPTVASDNFNLQLSNASADVINSQQFRLMFTG